MNVGVETPSDELGDCVATAPSIAYVAVATAESVHPVSKAMAFIVSVVSTLRGAEYTAPTVSVGVLPSVV
jgi:hypothetical protein